MTYKVVHFDRLNSTNTYALEHLAELNDHTVITADFQTAGRGQPGRSWQSANKENLYLSLILKPDVSPDTLPLFSLIMAEAAVAAFNEYLPQNKQAQIKPPNDILVNGQKIAGILTESKTLGPKVLGVVIGIGLNLNMTAEECAEIDQPATSLNLLCEKNIDKQIFQNKLLNYFSNLYQY